MALVGLLAAGVFSIFKLQGALLWSIAAATVFGMIPSIGVTPAFDRIAAVPAWGDFQDVALQLDIAGAFDISLVVVLLSLLILDLFDTAGTLMGVAVQAGYLDKDGRLPKADRALFSDAAATTISALVGTNTTTTYIESAAGVAAGGRTGLTGVVVAICFLLSLFFMPLVGMVPAAATAPVLMVVGIFMMRSITTINWDDFSQAFPAFLCFFLIPFTSSIADGIAGGVVAYSLVHILTGRAKNTNRLNGLAVVFVLYFVFLR